MHAASGGTADWRFVDDAQAYVVQGDMGLVLNNGDMMCDAAIASPPHWDN
jgi:hypothetical protein